MPVNQLLSILGTGFALYVTLIIYVRIVGLRSFAKMTAIDLAVSVAIGTVLSSTLLPSKPKYIDGAVTLAILFTIQFFISILRQRSIFSKKLMENTPVLIMDGNTIIEDNLKKSLMTKDDLMAKLREANAFNLDNVRGVILETTGDISVLHGKGKISPEVMEGVKGQITNNALNLN